MIKNLFKKISFKWRIILLVMVLFIVSTGFLMNLSMKTVNENLENEITMSGMEVARAVQKEVELVK